MMIRENFNESHNDNARLMKTIKNDKHGRTEGYVEKQRNLKYVNTKYQKQICSFFLVQQIKHKRSTFTLYKQNMKNLHLSYMYVL